MPASKGGKMQKSRELMQRHGHRMTARQIEERTGLPATHVRWLHRTEGLPLRYERKRGK